MFELEANEFSKAAVLMLAHARSHPQVLRCVLEQMPEEPSCLKLIFYMKSLRIGKVLEGALVLSKELIEDARFTETILLCVILHYLEDSEDKYLARRKASILPQSSN